AAFHTLTERAPLHPNQSLIDQIQGPLLILDEPERELLVIVLGAQVGHVEWYARKAATPTTHLPSQGLVRHPIQVAPEPRTKTSEDSAIRHQVLVLESVRHVT